MTDAQIEIVHARDEYETLLRCAERCQKDIDKLLARYGDGVRPEWVGIDIELARHQKGKYLARAEAAHEKISALSDELYRRSN